MFAFFAFLVLWPFLIGATIEARKVIAAASGHEAVDALDAKLPKLPFWHGAVSGFVLAPLFRALVLRLFMSDEPLLVDVAVPLVDSAPAATVSLVIMWLQWTVLAAFFGLGAGAVSGQMYEAVKNSYIDGIRDRLDWWRADDTPDNDGADQ